jgi:hypothetical protein
LRGAGAALALPFAAAAHAQPARPKPQARRMIFVVLDGGLSHVDSFDPKPALAQHAGAPLPDSYRPLRAGDGEAAPDATGTLLPSPWPARPRGESGIAFTSLFEQMGSLVDRFCVLRGMTTSACQHGPALRLLLTGHADPGHPAIGAWIAQRLGPVDGSPLPPFVALGRGDMAAGGEIWTHGFLPESCAAAQVDLESRPRLPPGGRAVVAGEVRARERMRVELDRRFVEKTGLDVLAVRAEARERERRLHERLHELWQGTGRGPVGVRPAPSPRGRIDYGGGTFARGCRLACALAEAGVRTVTLFSGRDHDGRTPWDVHERLSAMEGEARRVDQALAAMVRDLDQRGLLEETLVVVATEFGRSPLGTATRGREHNRHAFSVLLAGSGLTGGKVIGATDELGLRAVDRMVAPSDLLATILSRFRIRPADVSHRHRGQTFVPVDPGSQILRELRLG